MNLCSIVVGVGAGTTLDLSADGGDVDVQCVRNFRFAALIAEHFLNAEAVV